MPQQRKQAQLVSNGRLTAIIAIAGLSAVILAYIYMSVSPRTPEVTRPPNYDRVFKYCTEAFTPNEATLAALRKDSLYPAVAAIKPGEYTASNGAQVSVFGGGMFEINLPPDLRTVRDLGRDMSGESATDRPHSIIGCTPEHMAKVFRAYDIQF